MKFPAALRVAAVALATGALLVPSVTPAQAEVSYPPHVSTLYASPFLSTGGYASVSASGEYLTAGMTVQANRNSRYTVAGMSVDPTGVLGTAMVNVRSLLPTTAGRYPVDFTLRDPALATLASTTQTYTVGKAISIKDFAATRKSYGLYIGGKAAKYTPVKITVNFGLKTYVKTVTANSVGKFHWAFKKTTKGTYTVTAKVAPNKKYFSESVTLTYVRS